MAMFHRDLIGDEILDLGSSKCVLSDKDGGADYRADIQGITDFMVPAVANVRAN